MKEYFYLNGNNQQVGPMSPKRLKALKKIGVISNETQIWAEDLPDWRPYSDVFREIKQQPEETENKQWTSQRKSARLKVICWLVLVMILIGIRIVMVILADEQQKKKRERQAEYATHYYDRTARARCRNCNGTGVILSLDYGQYKIICPRCDGTGIYP